MHKNEKPTSYIILKHCEPANINQTIAFFGKFRLLFVKMSSYDDQNNENIYNLVQQEEVIAPKAPRYSVDVQCCHNWHYWPLIVRSTFFKTNRAEFKLSFFSTYQFYSKILHAINDPWYQFVTTLTVLTVCNTYYFTCLCIFFILNSFLSIKYSIVYLGCLI